MYSPPQCPYTVPVIIYNIIPGGSLGFGLYHPYLPLHVPLPVTHWTQPMQIQTRPLQMQHPRMWWWWRRHSHDAQVEEHG